MAAAARHPDAPHVPVLLRPLLREISPVSGTWLDGTFGAGGYARALLDAGADRVIGLDRDPTVFAMAEAWRGPYGDRLVLVQDRFSNLDAHGEALDGVVLDLGVSSMQLDTPERGFSFQKDGPLDMRMGDVGETAADIVNSADESELADILFQYGEEKASRRIARAIVRERNRAAITTTLQLAEIVESCLPRQKPGQMHPATRSFQALRIAVNAEYEELLQGLMAAERALWPGGVLAVATFHSIEDRMVKRFIAARAGQGGQGNRHAPLPEVVSARFEPVTKKAIGPDAEELEANPRARSAKLRIARRTDAPAGEITGRDIGMPETGGKSR